MKHQSKATIKQRDLLIAEAIIKGYIKKNDIKNAVELAEKKNISSERFGELTQIALNEV